MGKIFSKHIIGSAVILGVGLLFFNSCATMPEGATVVKPFDKKKFLGKWYEIARMDSRFEKNLTNVMAIYSLKDNGDIRVVNKGYDTEKNKWKMVKGKAKFRNNADEAALKVSFFGPFYSGYNVLAIDDEYTYALIAGNDLSLLWILSRSKDIPESVKREYLKIAEDLGYKTSQLTWVTHNDASEE